VIRSRKTLVVGLTAAIALGYSSSALATGATDQYSVVVGSANSPAQDDSKRGAAALFTQVQTLDSNNTGSVGSIPDQEAEQVFLDFDDDFKFTTKNAKCDPADIATENTQGAYDACKKALVGGGSALARLPGFPTENNDATFTVTTFNGPKTSTGTACPAGGDTCEFLGDLPSILLHARLNAPATTVVVQGEIQNTPPGLVGVTDASSPPTSLLRADYGKRLAVTNAPDAGGTVPGDGALVLFNSQVGAKYKKGKDTFNYVTANCRADTGTALDGGNEWDSLGTWEYDDGSTDFDTHKVNCIQK
jgi:hypothetical protein